MLFTLKQEYIKFQTCIHYYLINHDHIYYLYASRSLYGIKGIFMKDLFLVKVESYSGYKADEYPQRFYLDDMRFDIEEVLDRWYQQDLNPEFPEADYFKVLTTDKKCYILKHETKKDQWFLWIRGERINL